MMVWRVPSSSQRIHNLGLSSHSNRTAWRVASENWWQKKQIQKYSSRSYLIGKAHPPTSLSCYLYNVQAISVLQYVAQFTDPPEDILAIEQVALHRVLHFATNALPKSGYLNLALLGGPSVRSVYATMRAAMFAASDRFKISWQLWLSQLERTAAEHSTCNEVAQHKLSPSFWDTLPIAASLQVASAGWPEDRVLEGAVLETRHELQDLANSSRCSPASKAKSPTQRVAYKHIFSKL